MAIESWSSLWGKAKSSAPVLSVVVSVVVLLLGGGFFYSHWWNVPDLAYTILPTYALENQSFGGIVVENRGRATAHEVSIRLQDLGSAIDEYEIQSDEPCTVKEGGRGDTELTLWLERMVAGSSVSIYLLTSGPNRFDNMAVTAEEGAARVASARSESSTISYIIVPVLVGFALAVLSRFVSTVLDRRPASVARGQVEAIRDEVESITFPYDFVDHFAEGRQRGHSGSHIEPHLTATCGRETKRAIFEHPPQEADKFSTLKYDLVLPPDAVAVELVGFVGIETERPEREGRTQAGRRPDNPVQFEILIDGEVQFKVQKQSSEWEPFAVPIRGDGPNYREHSICFRTNCLGDPSWNWAVWGEPQLVEMTL